MISFLLVGTTLVFYLASDVEDKQLAMEEPAPSEILPLDTISQPITDTIQEEIMEKIDDEEREELERDGVEVAQVNDEVVEIYLTENEPVKIDEETLLAREDIKEEALVKAITTEEEFANALQGKASGIQIESAEATIVDKGRIDSMLLANELEDIDEPQVAMEKSKKVSTARSAKEPPANIRIRGTSSIKAKNENTNTVKGKITDDTGEPLPGVNVIIKGTTASVTTDLDGKYMLPKLEDMTLVFSFVGFESQQIAVGERTNIDVTMGGAMELQEVVVTGYGGAEEEGNTFSPARPNGGMKAYKKYLEESLIYPESAKENEIEGTVVLELAISSSGKIDSIDIKRSLGYGCDQEAIRLVKEGENWEAAKRGTTRVEDKVRVRVKFKL